MTGVKTAKRVSFGVTALCAALASCASPYTPSPDRPFEEIPEFTSTRTIALVNAQDRDEEVSFGGGVTANYHKWTEVAIEVAERELTKRGVTIDPNAESKLMLKLTRAQLDTGWVTIETQLDLDAESNDGFGGSYTGRNSSAMMAVVRRQIDGAVMRVVKELLSDPDFVAWLGS